MLPWVYKLSEISLIAGIILKTYVSQVLKRLTIQNCSPNFETPTIKEDSYSISQCSKTEIKKDSMEDIPYTSFADSLMYIQFYTP